MGRRRRSTKGARKPKFCVIGAGHGGLAMAGHLAILGHDVNLWNRSEQRVEAIIQRGSVDIEGTVEGSGILRMATSVMSEAVRDADIVMVVIPANGHRDVAELMAPHLRNGQTVILNPGRTGGALEVSLIFRERRVPQGVTVAEAGTFLYVSRHLEPTKARIFEIKNSVPLAALPAYRTPDVLRAINPVFPQFVPGTNILQTSYDNIGMVFHPPVTMLNAAWIESHHDFEYYIEGISSSVAKVLERVDVERRAVAAAVGVNTHSAREWLYLSYNSAGRTLY
ncbi:MAG TPA: NAD/NADP octopine/nopaline dehydrogenase family protein, partial [Thermoplasmata archaeon]|nr:NAD/NADP octopine/nopaline dehydrogenase family protein [Thermoplasmata archaeon]